MKTRTASGPNPRVPLEGETKIPPEGGTTKLPSVSVCFPTYNEEATIEAVLREAQRLMVDSGLEYEILVCNDGSSDSTGVIIRRLAHEHPELRVLEHETNRGIRATFEDLYAAATKEFVFLNSTDGQWDTAILFELLPMTSDWDVIIASRKDKHYAAARRLISWGFNLAPRLLFGVNTYDAGAVKLVRREIIERLPLVSRSPFSEAERLIRASRAGYRITHLPVTTNPRHAGKSSGVSFASVVRAIRDVIRVWRSRNDFCDESGQGHQRKPDPSSGC